MCKSYNGYTNYETWAVSLWIDNDEGLYNYVQELTIELNDTYKLSQALKDMHEENNPLNDDANVYSDLLQASLDNVNWYEIAENWMENCADDLPHDDDEEELEEDEEE